MNEYKVPTVGSDFPISAYPVAKHSSTMPTTIYMAVVDAPPYAKASGTILTATPIGATAASPKKATFAVVRVRGVCCG